MESEMNRPAEPESQAAYDGQSRGSAAFSRTKQTMQHAYDKSSRALGDTYDQALAFGRQNPGKATLIAFGIGVGVGMLLLSSPKRQSRVRRYGAPIVNALSNMAIEFIRNL
jgi:ElaB/YqjD/DUF883 family membrane-anchored ribosome-binding protein